MLYQTSYNRGYGKLGVYPLENPLESVIAAWSWENIWEKKLLRKEWTLASPPGVDWPRYHAQHGQSRIQIT